MGFLGQIFESFDSREFKGGITVLKVISMARQICGCLTFICIALVANYSDAALTLRINGSTAPGAINLMQSEQITLTISLAGTTPDIPTDPINNPNNFALNFVNLDSFGFRLETSSNIAIASAVISPNLNLVNSSISGNGTTIVSVSGTLNNASRPNLVGGVNLATFTISTPGPGNTTVRLRDLNTAVPGNNTTVGGAGEGPYNRDADIFSQASGLSTVSVNLVIAVPEPNSMLLLAAAGFAVVGFGARRRFAAK